jgi:hypothetical protein
MRGLIFAVVLCCAAAPALANARITILMDILRMPEVVQILHEEGLAYGADLDEGMLEGRGGAFWRAQVAQIYARDPILEQVRAALETGLSPAEVEAAIAFFGTPEGAQIIDYENTARRAMADPEIEETAQRVFDELAAAGDPVTAQVTAFIAANDLLERNVTGAMNANVQFYLGLSDGRYTDDSETQILQDVWAEQEAIRDDTERWLHGFLLLAYQPLPAEVMDAYIAYSQTPEGQALNAALFEGFETVYRDVSYALGRAVALNAQGDEI